MNIKTIGIDIAKNVFQVNGMDARGENSFNQTSFSNKTL